MTLSNKVVLGCVMMAGHVLMAVHQPPHVLLTYQALHSIVPHVEEHYVFARGDERIIGEAPSKDELLKFKNVDYYVTIGAPVEKNIEKTLLELNSGIKVFVATNNCHLIEGNYFLWYSWRNMEEMTRNCRAVLKPGSLVLGCFSASDVENSYREEKMVVGVTHDAFEYWCKFLGIDYLRLPENINDADLESKNIRLVYRARLGHKVRVVRPIKSMTTIVEADPFEFDHVFELFEPYRKVLQVYRREEEEKEWERKEKESVRKEQNAKSESKTNLCFPKTSALRSSATDVIEK